MRHIRMVTKHQAPKFRGMRYIRRYRVGFNLCGARQSGGDILVKWIARSRSRAVCSSCLLLLGRVPPGDAEDQNLQTEHIRSMRG
jgi:hypothetical protein